MNQSSKQNPTVSLRLVPDINPWQTEGELPRLPWPLLLVLSLLVIACASYHPALAPTQMHTTVLLLACALSLVLLTKSFATCAFSLLVFLLGYSFGDLATGTYLVCLLLTVAIGAYLICTCRSPYLAVLPVLSYLTALVLTQNALLCLLTLLAFPAAFMLACATMKNEGRVSAIVASSFALGLFLIAGLTLTWCAQSGAFSLASIVEALDALRDKCISALLVPDYMEAMQQLIDAQELGIEIDVAALLRSAFEQIFPALAITLVNLLCFTAQMACTHAFGATGLKQLITLSSRLFHMSIPSALIYLVCAVAGLFLSEQMLAAAVVQNLQLILLPGLCLIGIYKLIGDLRRKPSVFTIVFIVAIGTFVPALLVLGLAISGAITTVLRPFIAKALLAGQIPTNHQDDDSSDDSSNSDPS